MDIIIVTWNNADYLDCILCSLQANSSKVHDVFVHLNGCEDHSRDVLKKYPGVTYTQSKENEGLCVGTNTAAEAAKHRSNDRMLLIDDDMYFLPGWDIGIDHQIGYFNKHYKIPERDILINPVMIEPTGNHNLVIAPFDFGRRPDSLSETNLITFSNMCRISNRIPIRYSDLGPFCIDKKLFFEIGGYSEEFSPAIGSDNDLTKKAWDAGCQTIVSCPQSLVYHMQCSSTSRLKDYHIHAQSRDQKFKKMFGITVVEFHKEQLKRGTIWP